MKALIFKKSYTVVLSLLLVLAILFSNVAQIPSAIFAEVSDGEEALKSGAVIVSEDETKRGEYEKHYLTENGSYVAISYSDPVNYQTEDGTWKAVDNSLSENILTGNLSTKNEKFKVKFANKANHGKLVSVKTDGYDISWGITLSADGENYTELDKIKVSADTKNTNSLPKTVSEATSLGAAVSTATYENVYGDAVDVRYTVTHGTVKEDVILKKPSDINSYKATYNIKGEFDAILNVDGSVTVTDEQGETLFIIGAPYMYDAVGEVSEDITVSLLQSGKTLEVKYVLSEEWLGDPERVYPVTVDPSVSSRLYTGNIKDVSVYMDGVYTDTDHLKAYNRIGYEEPLYLHIDNVPTLPVDTWYVSSAFILYASTMSIFSPYADTHTLDNPMWITATEILNDWEDSGFNLTQCSSTTTIYNNGQLMQFGETVGIGTNDNITDVSGTTFKQIAIEYEWGDYEYFFSLYKGVRIDVSDHIAMNVVSAENAEYSSYRPAVIIRYSYTKPSEIGSGSFWTVKNVGSGKYLTIDGAGTTSGTNIYQESENQVGNQIVRFSYNTENAYYTMFSIYDCNVSVGYSDSLTQPRDNYENVKVVRTSSASRKWIVVPNGDYYSIVSTLDTTQAMTAMGMGNGTADTVGKENGNIFVTYYSADDPFQKWKIERANTKNVANSTNEPLYIQEGETLYLHATPQTGVTWTSSNEYVVPVNNIGAVFGETELGSAIISACIADEEVYSVEVNVALNDGTYYIRNREETLSDNALYIQIDNDDDENSFCTIGAKMELWKKSSELEQRWYINHIDGGYYSITSAISGLAIMVPSNKVTVNNQEIEQGMYTGSDNQLWRIQATNSGSVKIVNKATLNNNSNLVMCAGGAVAFADGNNVRNRNYDATNYYDEWYVEALGSGEVFAANSRNIFYMHTADNEYFSLESPSSTGENQTVYCSVAEDPERDGSYMWRFERVGAYYKIYSLNIAEKIEDDNNLLLVYDGLYITSRKSINVSGDEALWKIQRVDETYYISPKTAPGQYLCRVYDGEVFRAGMDSFNRLESVVCFKEADTYDFNAGLKNVSVYNPTIKCFVDNALWYDNVVDRDTLESIISQWNGISSSIELEFCGVLNINNTPQDSYYIVFDYDYAIDDEQYGETVVYDRNGVSLTGVVYQLMYEQFPQLLGEHPEKYYADHKDVIDGFVADKRRELYNTEWSRSEIVIRTINWRDLSVSQKKGVIIHEIGHALTLNHTAVDVLSVMRSGVGDTYLCDFVTVFDMYSLIKKLGI